MPEPQKLKIRRIGDGDWFMVLTWSVDSWCEITAMHCDQISDIFNIYYKELSSPQFKGPIPANGEKEFTIAVTEFPVTVEEA